MTTRALQKGDIHPETGEECCEPTLVSVPVDTVLRCQVLEPVTEEVAAKILVLPTGQTVHAEVIRKAAELILNSRG